MRWIFPRVFLPFLVAINCLAAGERKHIGAREAALGGASVTIPDLWSVKNNQAGLAWIKNPMTGIAVENRFMLPELSSQHLCAILPLRIGAAGLSLSGFGNQYYHELEAGFAFSRKFGSKFSAGLLIKYLRLQTASEYGSANLASFDIGLLFRPKNSLAFGVQISNPYPVRLVREPVEILDQSLNIGVNWQLSETVSISCDAEKSGVNPLSILAGMEYQPARNIFTRIGISTQPYTFSFGAGVVLKNFTLDVSSEYHPALGFSPACSVQYTFNKLP